jgi:hypothetical protein
LQIQHNLTFSPIIVIVSNSTFGKYFSAGMQGASFMRSFSAFLLSLCFLWVQVLAFSRITEPVRFQLEKEQYEHSVQTEDATIFLNLCKKEGGDRHSLYKGLAAIKPELKTYSLYNSKFRRSFELVDKWSFVRASLYKWHHSWKIDLV